MMVEIKITYETLFDLLRREKNREELQKLDADFYEQVLSYLKEKEAIVSRKEDTSYFSNDKEKLKIQFQNIRRLVKELYERREKKIINIALVKARTGSDVIDTSSLLLCEVRFFEEQVLLFSKYKRDILDNIINLGELNFAPPAQQGTRLNAKFTAMADEEVSYEAAPQNPEVHFKPASEIVKKEKDSVKDSKEASKDSKKIKILEYLPKFMGLRGEVLGPYEKDAVVEIDNQIADLLVKKGRAQQA